MFHHFFYERESARRESNLLLYSFYIIFNECIFFFKSLARKQTGRFIPLESNPNLVSNTYSILPVNNLHKVIENLLKFIYIITISSFIYILYKGNRRPPPIESAEPIEFKGLNIIVLFKNKRNLFNFHLCCVMYHNCDLWKMLYYCISYSLVMNSTHSRHISSSKLYTNFTAGVGWRKRRNFRFRDQLWGNRIHG